MMANSSAIRRSHTHTHTHTVTPITPTADHEPLSKSNSAELLTPSEDGDADRKKGGSKGSAKRSKYRTDEERVAKEKERRNANNQRER